MKFGVFCIPYSLGYPRGTRSAKDVIDWDLQVVEWADQYGLSEAFFAEHFTIGNEPSPAPDSMIAAASQRTESIKLGAAAHLLPYHNPIALAHRIMWLDHMTGGRYIAGVAPGAFPSDAQLFGTGTTNVKRMHEALDIIEAIWTKTGPFKIEGEYYSVDMPAFSTDIEGPHLKPRQARIPMFVTGMQPTSPSLTTAGRRGYFPMSQQVHDSVLVKHWETYSLAAEGAGHQPQRSNWRICREIFVADTDEEARNAVFNGAMGELWKHHNIATFIKTGIGEFVTGGTIPESDLTVEWLVDNLFLIGSPDTVAEKAAKLYETTGGFGTLLTFVHDYGNDQERYRHNLELLGREVAPRLADLQPAASA